jgi:hypothetical protein
MNGLQQNILKWVREEKAKVLIILIISLLMVAFSRSESSDNKHIKTTETVSSPDTFIPAGFVLVPIEIQNLQNVDSMIGNYGIVDIYNGKKTEPVLSGARIIRSPLDPTQFAVMVSDSDAPLLIAETHEPLRIVLQNPDTQPKQKTKIQSIGARQIFIGGTTR